MASDSDREVVERLDRIIFLMNLAFRDTIQAAKQAVLSDPVTAAILDTAAEQWITAGELKRTVVAATKQSERTVNRRMTQLVGDGWLAVTGGGGSVRYRSTERP